MRTEEPLALGVFGRGSRLGERIELLLRRGRDFSPRASLARAGVSAAVLAAFLIAGSLAPRWIAFAQEPAFESASVRPAKDCRSCPLNGSVRTTPGRFIGTNAPARLLIRWAYGVKDYQLAGGPKWIEEDRFDVEGKAAAAASDADLRAMLRTLLADRFKLTVHRETKTMAVYNMVLGKGGPKFQPLKPGEKAAPGPMRDGAVSRMFASSVSGFADMLSTFPSIGRPVLDKTSLTGNYFLDIQSGPDEDVFSIVQDQGLRLETANAPIEMLVIDGLEKPAGN